MAFFMFALAVICAGITGLFSVAGDMSGHGSPWARDVCPVSQQLCHSPELGGFAAVGFSGSRLLRRLSLALHG